MDKDKIGLLLKEFYDSINDENVNGFLAECIETIPNYWYSVPASMSGKYHPNYALGDGGLLRHTVVVLGFFNRLVSNGMCGDSYTEKELDLMRVACLMHDSRKCGSDEDYSVSQRTKFDHPILAANVVRSIDTKFINNEEKELVANAIEAHMGQWNTDTSGKCKVILPTPQNKFQKIVHLADYLAATKWLDISCYNFQNEEKPVKLLNDIFSSCYQNCEIEI